MLCCSILLLCPANSSTHRLPASQIINSLEKGRLADAALFATGVRPEHGANGETQSPSSGQPQLLPKIEGSDELQVHKAAFFFKLERELEKVSSPFDRRHK